MQTTTPDRSTHPDDKTVVPVAFAACEGTGELVDGLIGKGMPGP